MSFEYHRDWESPKNGEIFVFGSNLAGRHGAGAAKEAIINYGATYGRACGMQGQSYAIATKDMYIETMPLCTIKFGIDIFVEYAIDNPTKKFWITRIGCGLAGYKDETIAPLFKNAPSNCIMPEPWKLYLKGEVK